MLVFENRNLKPCWEYRLKYLKVLAFELELQYLKFLVFMDSSWSPQLKHQHLDVKVLAHNPRYLTTRLASKNSNPRP
jgi:hypothetical protein